MRDAIDARTEYPTNRSTDEFIEHGDHYRVETLQLEDSQVVTVTIATDSEPPQVDRFSGTFAEREAHAFVTGRIEATDPARASLEEQLAPHGEEWQREQDERDEPFNESNDGSQIF